LRDLFHGNEMKVIRSLIEFKHFGREEFSELGAFETMFHIGDTIT
jgi:hypothetical protein